MALKKKIELENGISLSYHRIATINKITNKTTIIEISSYINEEQRQKEYEAIERGQETGEAVPMNVLIKTAYIEKEYNETDTIKDLYEYLKTIDIFKDAIDV